MSYYHMIFDNFREAVNYQREKLEFCIGKGWPIRAAEINSDTDYDTKVEMYSVLVRAFEIEGPW